MDTKKMRQILLSTTGSQLVLRLGPEEDGVPVRALKVAPLSEGDRIVSIVDEKNKDELVLLTSLDELDQSSAEALENELKRRYFLPKIEKINDVSIHLGDYYWDVVTDRGPKKFMLRAPAINMRRVGKTRIILCDSNGINYDLDGIDSLSKASRKLLDGIL